MSLVFLSAEWREEACTLINANPAVRRGFKDADSFTHLLACVCEDETSQVTYLSWREGVLVEWHDRVTNDDDTWLAIAASRTNWMTLATSGESASRYLLKRKLRLTKGSLASAMANAPALNEFIRTCAVIDTAWGL